MSEDVPKKMDMSTQPSTPPRPNRKARRAVRRPGSKDRGFKEFELSVRGPLRTMISRADTSGVDDAPATPTEYVLCVVAAGSPFDRAAPPEKRLQPGTIHVVFIQRPSLVNAMAKREIGPDGREVVTPHPYGEQILRPHPCGHWWVLLSGREQSRFCCTRCDLKIEAAAS